MNPPNQGICAGKHAIAEYLIQYQGFRLLELIGQPPHRITDEPNDELRLQASDIRKSGDAQTEFVFDTADALLDFATKRWQGRWVTTDIADGLTLDRFLLRPFFLLVSVDAPVSLRWKRFSDRFVACTYHRDSSKTVAHPAMIIDAGEDNWMRQTWRNLSCGMIAISTKKTSGAST